MTRVPALLATAAMLLAGGALAAGPTMAPEFTQRSPAEWINTPPLTMAQLRGQVVLVEFWTFGCSNCLRTLPWLKAAHGRYAPRGLVVIGVHTPEFEHERGADAVRAAVRRLDVRYPVVVDDDFSTWRAWSNRYWPAFYLVDRNGRIESIVIGELHSGTPRADRFEDQIRRLLAEPG